MLSTKNFLRLAFITTTSLAGCLIAKPLYAASFATSEALLSIDNFSTLPLFPDAESNRSAIAVTGNSASIIDANGDGNLSFIVDRSNTTLDLDFNSNATGSGLDYFGVGQSDSFAVGIFSVAAREIFSFDFTVSLALESIIDRGDSSLDASINNFSAVSFALFDNSNDSFLGQFSAMGNIDTNLANGINNDTVFATISNSLDSTVSFFDDSSNFSGLQETASLDVTGSIQQTFINGTEVRLEASTFNISCIQAPQTDNPCFRASVPESSNILGLLLGVLGFGLLVKKQRFSD